MLLTKEDNLALILIDFQKGFDNIQNWGIQRNNFDAETNAAILLKIWRDNHLPIFHVKHNSVNPHALLHESNPGNRFKDLVKPLAGETIITKSVNSAFIGTDLKEQLDFLKVTKLVIIGLTTDHCVSTTTRMACNYGFDIMIVSDATATFNRIGPSGTNFSAELMHQTALASLRDEFAEIVSTDFIKKMLS